MADNVNSMTQRLLVDAGIVTGMRVVDIGCGNGEVSLLLAKLVGEGGEVIGLDLDEKSLTAARKRVHQQNLSNVTFIKSDLSGPLPQLAPFDALVGRRVLMYLPDPVNTIRRFTAALRPGGLAVFQESDSTLVPGRRVPMPLHEQVSRWVWQTVEREGGDIHIGFALQSILEQSGLIVEHVRAEAVIQGQNTHYPLAFIVRAMLPRIIEHEVANVAEIDIETLEQRLSAERMAANSIFVSDMAFGAWARRPF
jgi:ubiquinone/menaquinone biosynthesis C-methylase UbiE